MITWFCEHESGFVCMLTVADDRVSNWKQSILLCHSFCISSVLGVQNPFTNLM